MVFESIVGVKCFGTFVTRKTVLTMHLLVLKQFVLSVKSLATGGTVKYFSMFVSRRVSK